MFEFLKKLFGFNKSAPLPEAVAPIIENIEDKFADKIEELVVPIIEEKIANAIVKVEEAVPALEPVVEKIAETVEHAVPALEPVVEEVMKKVRKPRAPRKPKTPK
jgi:hypothetical protein